MKHTDYLKKKKNREIRRRVVSILSAIVVFVATYALVLPALTLDVKTARMEPGMSVQQEADPEAVSAPEAPAEEEAVEESTKEEEPAEAVEPEKEEKSVKEESAKEDQSAQAEEQAPAEEASKDKADEAAQKEDAGQADADSAAADQAPAKNDSSSDAVDQSGADAAEENTKEAAAEAFKVPELEAIDFNEILTDKTDFYYYHADKDEDAAAVSSTDIDDWKKATKDTVLAPEDFVRVYLAYTIPAGALNETNATASYRLPDSLELTDKQIKAINKNENGISGTDKDAKDYKKYLGAEAIEGTRTPDKSRGDDEYISATVKVEKVYENDKYVGQELVFTFAPYTVQKNQISYDDKGNVTSEGKAVKGWFSFDLTPSRIGFEETEDAAAESGLVRSEAKITFVKENNNKDIDEISRALTLDAPAGTDADKTEEKAEQAAEQKTLTYEGSDYTVIINYTDDAQIPDNAELAVSEIGKDTPEYNDYLEQAKAAVKEDKEDKTVNEARFFDITILADGEKVEPAAPVNVQINFAGIEQTKAEDAQLLHYKDDKNVEVMDKAEFSKSEEAENEEKAVDTVQFEADGFSVYGIVGTETLTGGFVTADGRTYEVTVTYDADAEIPKGSSLELIEYTEDSEEYQNAKIKIDEFKANEVTADEKESEEEAAESEDDEEQYGFSALGISIIGLDGSEVEPKSEVRVSIVMKSLPEGFEAEDIQQTMEVHHLAESEGNIAVEKVAAPVLEGSEITADDNGAVAEFITDSFSIYTITWGNTNQNQTTLHFVDENGNELTGVKYNGNVIDGNTVRLTDILTNNTTLDLRSAFTVDGKTLSNTHINSIANLGTNNARQIVANEIRREGNNFRYRTFNENGDDSGSSWNTIANNSNLYLVYSDVPGGGGGGGTTPDDPDAPDFGTIGNSKVKTDNGNGTYKLNLSVTGQAQSASANNHVNVLIVLDTSSSMTSNGRTRLADAKRALVGTTQAEIEASICHKLLSNNTTDDPNIVQLAFVTFAGSADYHSFGSSYWTTNEATFRTEVNGVGTASGTNWEDAMKYAATVVAAADSDPTYVIFLTDGQPSRYWRGGNPSQYVDGEGCMLAACDEARALRRDYGTEIYGIFAWGSNDNFTKDYLGKMIGYAYNNNDVISSHRFNGQDSAQLVSDLEKILNIISLNFGFADVTFNDGITGLTSTDVSLATVEDDSFEYTITYVDAQDGQTHTVAATKNDDGTVSIPSVTYNVQDRDNPGQYKSKTTEAVTVTGAEYIDGRVIWHIEQTESTDPYILEEAWTYTVSFDIWPSQHAYDLVAALNNDPSIWGQSYTFVDDDSTITYEQYLAQISGGPNGPFELKTNTDANVTYKQVTAKTVDGVTTYEYSDPIEVPVSYTGGMSLTSEDMTVEKQWYNPLDSRPVEDEVELSVTLDNKEFLSHIILDSEHDYKHEVFIACGIITEDDDGYEIKETGHDFTFAEVHDENTFYWNLEAEVYRPMLINGKLNLLIKQDSAEGADYVIGGNYYKKGPEGAASISATNVRRSRLNLRKFVTDETDGTVDPDADFTYTITINEANDEDVYFSVFGTNGAQYLTPEQGVIVSNNVTPQMMQDDSGEHQYYYVPAGEEFTVNAKAGWSLMFLNLSNGTTYTISESMPAGFELGGEEGSANEYYYATPGDPSSRTTRPVAHNMKFNGVTTSGTITQSNTQYRVDYTNVWKSKDVTLIKVKEDGQTEIGEAVFDIAKKNAAGSFVSVGTFTSSTEDEVLGEVFKLGYGIYCLTETKAPDGYVILTNKIYFNLTTDGIVLCDENGNAATYENAVVSGEDLLTVTITNTPGAALPMTGGPGTFLYTLSGLILVLGSALMYGFRMRRRERRLN